MPRRKTRVAVGVCNFGYGRTKTLLLRLFQGCFVVLIHLVRLGSIDFLNAFFFFGFSFLARSRWIGAYFIFCYWCTSAAFVRDRFDVVLLQSCKRQKLRYHYALVYLDFNYKKQQLNKSIKDILTVSPSLQSVGGHEGANVASGLVC